VDGVVQLRFEEAIPLQLPLVRRSVLETIVLTIKNLFDHITAGAARTTYASFPFAEPYAALAREMFNCEVRYEQPWCGFAFPSEALDIPLSMADPVTLRQVMQVCQRELDKTSQQQSWAGKLQRLLLETQGTFPSLNVAARLLNVTPRTLHRRLVEEGTSYRAVIDEVRQLLAAEHLKVGKLPSMKLRSRSATPTPPTSVAPLSAGPVFRRRPSATRHSRTFVLLSKGNNPVMAWMWNIMVFCPGALPCSRRRGSSTGPIVPAKIPALLPATDTIADSRRCRAGPR
jgi:AraC-like DNA-binding protein